MIVIKNALSKELIEKARSAFWHGGYKHNTQTNPDYYQQRPGQSYMCSYKRGDEKMGQMLLEVGQAICEQLAPYGVLASGNNMDLHAYKMTEGDFFREHDDAKNGTGLVLYVSDRWEWDWGGLLMVEEGDRFTAYKPEYNQLVVIPKGKPHFVTRVAEYACLPRYAVVGFIKN